MLYAPQFSYTPLYRRHIRKTDAISIVFDGEQVSFSINLFLLWKWVFEILTSKKSFSLRNVLSRLTCHSNIWYQSYFCFWVFLGPLVTSDTKMLFKRQKFNFRPVKNCVLGDKLLHVKNEHGGKCVKNEETGIVNTFNNGNQLFCCQWACCWALIP